MSVQVLPCRIGTSGMMAEENDDTKKLPETWTHMFRAFRRTPGRMAFSLAISKAVVELFGSQESGDWTNSMTPFINVPNTWTHSLALCSWRRSRLLEELPLRAAVAKLARSCNCRLGPDAASCSSSRLVQRLGKRRYGLAQVTGYEVEQLLQRFCAEHPGSTCPE